MNSGLLCLTQNYGIHIQNNRQLTLQIALQITLNSFKQGSTVHFLHYLNTRHYANYRPAQKTAKSHHTLEIHEAHD